MFIYINHSKRKIHSSIKDGVETKSFVISLVVDLILADNNWIKPDGGWQENATGPAFLISMLNSLIAFPLQDLPAALLVRKSH